MKQTRLEDWDYSWNGLYFVTIITQQRKKYFGQIRKGEINLSNFGEIANSCWLDIPNHHNNVILDEYVIMPDHIHGIIKIHNPETEQGYYLLKRKRKNLTIPEYSTEDNPNLRSIIGSYKSACTKIIRAEHNYLTFKWQKSFFDSIICNELALMRIRDYIKNNPKNYSR